MVHEEVLDLHTNATSLDENLALEPIQIYIEEPYRTSRVFKKPNQYVGHIVNTLHIKYSDPLTYGEATNDSNLESSEKQWI